MQLLQEHFSVTPERTLQDSASFLGTGAIDSAGIIRLIRLIEQRFTIRVLDEEIVADNFDSLSQASEFVFRKLGQ